MFYIGDLSYEWQWTLLGLVSLVFGAIVWYFFGILWGILATCGIFIGIPALLVLFWALAMSKGV